jgi:hypothetical protein
MHCFVKYGSLFTMHRKPPGIQLHLGGKGHFFQIEVMVVKNLKHQDFIDGQHDQNKVKVSPF